MGQDKEHKIEVHQTDHVCRLCVKQLAIQLLQIVEN